MNKRSKIVLLISCFYCDITMYMNKAITTLPCVLYIGTAIKAQISLQVVTNSGKGFHLGKKHEIELVLPYK